MTCPLRSAGITPLPRYYGPGRHRLAFGRFPGFAGYLSGEGDQVTHAAAASGHGYGAAEDPWILFPASPFVE